MNKNKLENAIRKYNLAKQEVLTQVEDYLTELHNTIFNQFPINKIVLVGYTPSFNDGDLCYFTDNLCYPDVHFTSGVTANEEEWTTAEGDYLDHSEAKQEEDYYRQICELFGVIPSWAFEEIYGSYPFELSITKEGIEKEDYSRGY